MTIHLLTIPDTPQEWPHWLTERFCSGQLPLLVQELHLLGGHPDTDNEDLDDVLPPDRQQDVALNGLEILTTDELQHLFAQPDTLLQLHAFLCLCGGPRWSPLWSPTAESSNTPPPSTLSAADRIWQRALELKPVPTPLLPIPSEAAPRTILPPAVPHRRWQSRVALVATVATLLLAIFVWRQNEPRSPVRVLNAPQLLSATVSSPAEWFKTVADAGAAWFDQKPRTTADLAALLRQVSQDCQLLIDSPPPLLLKAPLAPSAPGDPTSQAEWFVQKCRKWKDDFDNTLNALENGQLDLETARSQADKTMMKLISVLTQGPEAPTTSTATTGQG
jgi:hypothetical protein